MDAIIKLYPELNLKKENFWHSQTGFILCPFRLLKLMYLFQHRIQKYKATARGF
jgi:hypothetical protein